MVFAKEQIEIVTTMVDNVTGASKRINKSIQEVGNGMYRTQEQVTGYDAKGRQLNRTTDTITRGQHRFKMELLGVMFAGMALWRVTSGLIKAQFELFGITEMFGNMMTVIFLPVMTELAPLLYSLMEWFMNLPEPAKKAISIFIFLAAAVGAFLMLFGQIGLGFFSIMKAFPLLAGLGGKIVLLFKGIAAAVGVTAGALAAIIAVVIAIAIGIYVAFKENFMNIKLAAKIMINGFKRMFKGLFDWFATPFRLIAALIRGDFKGVWEAVKTGFMGMINFITGLLQGLYGAVTIIAIGLFRVFKWIWDMIVKGFTWLKDKLVGHSIIPDIVNKIIDWFWKLPNMIFSVVKVLANSFIGLGNSIINVWNSVLGTVGKVLVNILRMADKAIAVVNKIPGVNIPRYSWSLNWGNLPNIPYLAEGGIITKPTLAMLGERGAEKVVPLDKSSEREIIINQTNYINISDKEEMEKLIRENNVNLVEEIKRQVAV